MEKIMKKLIAICLVASLMLVLASTSWATSSSIPMVTPPTDAPSWWNSSTGLYAYGWWSADIISGGSEVSPPTDPYHWASNYLSNTDFEASIGIGADDGTVSLELGNEFHADLQKQIYVYITGMTNSTVESIKANVATDGVFSGSSTWNINESSGVWSYVLSGVITPQPHFVNIDFTVPGMTSVTNVWAGEDCIPIPEPATIGLLGLGTLSLIRRKKSA
jgi:PEP-CTERM motif